MTGCQGVQYAWVTRSRVNGLLIGCAVALGIASSTFAQRLYDWNLPPAFPMPFVPSENPMSAAKVELGRYLFYDTRLSGNGTQSCATCHQQHLAFTDGRGQSIGSTQQLHPRGSMSLVNIAYAASLTWANPTMTRLEDQVLVPMYGSEPVELGLNRSDEWLFMFQRDPIYESLFNEAFPGSGDPITRDNVVKALASFERSIISARSPYDRYRYAGDETAISAAAKRGEALFQSRQLACSTCHNGFSFSGTVASARDPAPALEFHNTGLYNLPGLLSYPAPNTGIHELTRNPKDIGKFKAPTLRNIAMTAPYMHDGSVASLEDAVAHYSAGGRTISEGPHRGIGRENPDKSSTIKGFTLTDAQRRDLIAFLQSLTDEQLLRDPRFADPWKGLLRGGSSGW
jgi:cytochrome c peroxidase